eukprot:Hpha_TRINITY_DN26442_c0_g1::TRINITY_DN26442_c0_g1_i1::g.33983::m.33983
MAVCPVAGVATLVGFWWKWSLPDSDCYVQGVNWPSESLRVWRMLAAYTRGMLLVCIPIKSMYVQDITINRPTYTATVTQALGLGAHILCVVRPLSIAHGLNLAWLVSRPEKMPEWASAIEPALEAVDYRCLLLALGVLSTLFARHAIMHTVHNLSNRHIIQAAEKRWEEQDRLEAAAQAEAARALRKKGKGKR